jgi:hypothetical protein
MYCSVSWYTYILIMKISSYLFAITEWYDFMDSSITVLIFKSFYMNCKRTDYVTG